MSTNKKLAAHHSMDIPHMTAVEMPLIVNNNQRAIDMLGGKQKISQVINVNNTNKSIQGIKPEDEKPLELRLRNNPYHHPIQSISNSREKVVLKVSIPKNKLPSDYKQPLKNYTIRQLLIHNNQQGGDYQVIPIGIIDKTHSFKTMTDFQMSTKNNQLAQQTKNMFQVNNFNQFEQQFSGDPKTEGTPFLNNKDFQDAKNYENSDKHLPPPPLFSNIKFPFDYQYEKNPHSVIIKDPTSGNLQVVKKKADVKLHTQVIDFNKSLAVPEKPDPRLIENYNQLEGSVKSGETIPESYNYDLFHCIDWLHSVFKIKPIWLRKHLENVVPPVFKRVLKQALPYVTYIYKNGPWRFCNVKYGINPVLDKSYWKFQSEYFRMSTTNNSDGIGNKSNETNVKEVLKVLPKTIEPINVISNDEIPDNVMIDQLKVSRNLIFHGDEIPNSVTFQVGDIVDPEITSFLNNHQNGNSLLRDQLDYQDGWINKQVIETVRRIVKYKLNQLVHEQEIDSDKIHKIIHTNYDKDDMENESDESNDVGNLTKDSEIDPELRGSDIIKQENPRSEIGLDDNANPKKSPSKTKLKSRRDMDDRNEPYIEEEEMSDPEDAEEQANIEAEAEADVDIDAENSDSEFINSTEPELISKVKQYDSVAAKKLNDISEILKQEAFM